MCTTAAVPQSLLSVLSQSDDLIADERPVKRRKVAKSGPYSLAQENGISPTGVPLGYIPLARLALRMVSIDRSSLAAVEVACLQFPTYSIRSLHQPPTRMTTHHIYRLNPLIKYPSSWKFETVLYSRMRRSMKLRTASLIPNHTQFRYTIPIPMTSVNYCSGMNSMIRDSSVSSSSFTKPAFSVPRTVTGIARQ